MLAFAESTTVKKKLEYLDHNIDFKIAFISVYPIYYKHLVISRQREKLIKIIESHHKEFDVTSKCIAETIKGLSKEDASLYVKDFKFQYKEEEFTKREFDKYVKRLTKLMKRMQRKYKYRLRASYFDNYLVNDWIYFYNKFNNHVFLDLITRQVDEIIIRQVKRLKLYQFGTALDDLLQEIRVACLTALNKFDPSKGKSGREAFNYFSLICIKAGRMITLRQSDRFKQEMADSEIVADALADIVESRYYDDDAQHLLTEGNDMLADFYNFFYELFDRKERMQLLLQIMIRFILVNNNYSFKKNEFVRFAKSHGFTSAFINKFLTIIKANKEKFEKE